MTNKIIILGLDGATWTKLDEYIKKGTMPNFQSIIKKGTKSTFIPIFLLHQEPHGHQFLRE